MLPYRYSLFIRLTHLGLIVFGISAFFTGEWAEEEALGYWVHAYLGLALTLFILSRTIVGVVGPKSTRFSSWLPITSQRFSLVIDDIKRIFHFELPQHDKHEGLPALAHAFGIVL